MQLPEYTQALQKGREIRSRLNQLYPKETELEQEHYGRALRLPNTTHPDVVRMHTCTHAHFDQGIWAQIFCEVCPFQVSLV